MGAPHASSARTSPSTIRWWIHTGRLAATKPGRRVLIVEEELDSGKIFMISKPVPAGRGCEDKIKDAGGRILARTLKDIAEGKYSVDEEGNLYFDGKLIENGLREEAFLITLSQ